MLGIFGKSIIISKIQFCYHLENQVCSLLTENKIIQKWLFIQNCKNDCWKIGKAIFQIWILEKLEAPQMNGLKELLKIVKKVTFEFDNP